MICGEMGDGTPHCVAGFARIHYCECWRGSVADYWARNRVLHVASAGKEGSNWMIELLLFASVVIIAGIFPFGLWIYLSEPADDLRDD